jgi:hypothetical protein
MNSVSGESERPFAAAAQQLWLLLVGRFWPTQCCDA